MPKFTSFICVILSFLLTLCACANLKPAESDIPVLITEENYSTTDTYLDDITFLGESTTYHLKSRGVLSGGKNTTQVWAPKSGTLMLDASICECRIIYPETKEELSLGEALKLKKPKYMLLTFGLNGATAFISKGEGYFKYCYQKLIDLIFEYSPDTKIIINSCFPIAKNMDMSRYTVDAKTLNAYIDTINGWARALASENGVFYTDTASRLKDEEGYLKPSLQAEDGYHLNESAYREILSYLNENRYEKQGDR